MKMGVLTRLRQWANRDDGRFFRVGNEPIGFWETSSYLSPFVAIALWNLHKYSGISAAWFIAAGVACLILLVFLCKQYGNRGGT